MGKKPWKYAKCDKCDLGNRYRVYESGMIVDNFTGGMVLWIRGSSHGYPEVYLHDVNGKHYNLLAHRIVAHTYIGDVTGKIVHHSDENKENPAVDNLIIEDTQTDHLQHHVVGDSNPTAVLTNEEVHSICKLLEDRVPFPKNNRTGS